MALFDFKLCWFHDKYTQSLISEKCGTQCESTNDSTIPECHANCKTYTKIKRAFEVSGLPDKYWYPPDPLINSPEDISSLSAAAHVRRNIYSFVKNGQNLWMYSDIPGNGKTYRAVAMAATYIASRIVSYKYFDNMVRYIYIPKLVSTYEIMERYSFENESRTRFLDNLQDLYETELVIWDEFGHGSDSRIESVIFRSIINDRINNGRSNIFISGKSLQEVSSTIGRSMLQRIQGCSLMLNFRGPDLRLRDKDAM